MGTPMRQQKKPLPSRLLLAGTISTLLALPFVVLELVNRRDFQESFPFFLFGLLWLLPAGFILILIPIIRDIKAMARSKRQVISLMLRAVLLIVIGGLWAIILGDQMPCFLGIPNGN